MRLFVALLFSLCACGGDDKKVEAPSPSPEPALEEPASFDAVHDALVDIHKEAVEECFGGFGKGAPYAVEMTLGDGKIANAVASPLAEDSHGQLPKDCIEKHFVGKELPPTDRQKISGRFAVKNDSCDRPECPPKDLPCTFKRDIACTVILD